MTHSPTPTTPEPDLNHDPLAFTPVPCNRHDGWTAKRQSDFIWYLSRIGLVGSAAKAVGKSRQSAYALRSRNGAESFAAAWDVALTIGQSNAQDHAIERALKGYEVPYFYRGQQRGTVRRYSDRLLIAALTQITRRKNEASKNGSGGTD